MIQGVNALLMTPRVPRGFRWEIRLENFLFTLNPDFYSGADRPQTTFYVLCFIG